MWTITCFPIHKICMDCKKEKSLTTNPYCRRCCKKGDRNPSSGKIYTEEERKRCSEKQKGIPKPKPEGFGKTVSERLKGKKRPYTNKNERIYPTKEQIYELHVVQGKRLIEVAKILGWSNGLLQKLASLYDVRDRETGLKAKKNAGSKNKGHIVLPEMRQHLSKISKLMWTDEEYRAKQLAVKEQKCIKSSISLNKPECRERRSRALKEKWKNSEFIEKQQKGRKERGKIQSPNKFESRFLSLSERMKWGFEYTGNFQFYVGRRCPDFYNGKNLIVELFGDYWHKDEDPSHKINFYKSHGYSCLVIWESEFTDDLTIIAKVRQFLKENN